MVQSEKPFGELFGVDDNEVDALVLTEMVVYLTSGGTVRRLRQLVRQAERERWSGLTIE